MIIVINVSLHKIYWDQKLQTILGIDPQGKINKPLTWKLLIQYFVL